jgi:hypothetical protein
MGRPIRCGIVAAIAFASLLASAPAALAGSATDQYSEGFPTARGQESSGNALGGQRNAQIPPRTKADLERSGKGSAAEKAAQITAPPGGSSDSGDGLGWWLVVILVASSLFAVGRYLARRR